VLCRQIAEAHGGSLSLENRPDRRGCVATLRLETRAETNWAQQAGLFPARIRFVAPSLWDFGRTRHAVCL